MTIATMTTKGQITLPVDVRARLRLGAGTKFSVSETADGDIVLRPKLGDIKALKGIVQYDGPPVSIEEMKHAVGQMIAKRSLDKAK